MRESSTNYNILADIFTCPLRYGNLSPDDQRDQEKCQACSAICFQFCPASLTCNSRIFQPLVNKGEWKRNVSRRSSSWTNYSVYVYKHMKSEAFLGKYTPARELFSSSASCNLHISLTTGRRVYQQQQHCHQCCHRPRSFPFQKVSIVVA